jgi:hypothetical protein
MEIITDEELLRLSVACLEALAGAGTSAGTP